MCMVEFLSDLGEYPHTLLQLPNLYHKVLLVSVGIKLLEASMLEFSLQKT